MKNRIKIGKTLVGFLLAIIFLSGCTDDSYLVDGGKANPYYDGNILSFLKSRPDYFKDLVEIINLADMENILEDETITFFAPTDWSIRSSFDFLNNVWYRSGHDSIKSFSQIDPDVWKEFLSMYIVKDKYLLKDIPQIDTTAIAAYPGQAYLSYGDLPMNMGVVYKDANGVKYAGERQIIYSYVYDITVGDMKNAYVATSDIQPVNGVIHVIRFTDHTFGFDPYLFATRAIDAVIDTAPDN
ncbi:MAG: fasciclin domain-containing protein [Dysgonamonadaceae bacterium]|jgi:hypothetical protein|nr:fasciclin domain-containing protein [Dysgonamonadaceae bacterium]